MVTHDGRAAKQALRGRILAARTAADPSARARDTERITAGVLALPELGSARTVAAYHSFGTEPSTTTVLAALSSRGTTVLLPVLRPDHDLTWSIYDQSAPGPADAPHLWTPPGPRLGVDAVAEADLVVVPALAIGRDGVRLGRGGGSYDRALPRVRPDVSVVALLYDGELVDAVPAEPHDRRVTTAVLPSGTVRFASLPS